MVLCMGWGVWVHPHPTMESTIWPSLLPGEFLLDEGKELVELGVEL